MMRDRAASAKIESSHFSVVVHDEWQERLNRRGTCAMKPPCGAKPIAEGIEFASSSRYTARRNGEGEIRQERNQFCFLIGIGLKGGGAEEGDGRNRNTS